MAPFPIVKHLDVVEHISSCFIPSSITNPIDAFALEYAKEALDSSIVVAVS